MCGRFVSIQTVKKLEKRFNVKLSKEYQPAGGFNIGPGKYAPVITDREPDILQSFRFGLTPFWAKKPMYLFNARSEGDNNKTNDPAYTGEKGIYKKPAFRKAIRSQRCLVIADAFIEGTTQEKLDKPFLVYMKNQERPFAFAGIWDEWQDPKTRKYIKGFSIITTTPNELLQKLPHHRSPVILNRDNERLWLQKGLSLDEVLALLNSYPAEKMEAYPIDKAIKNPKAEGKHLIMPVGPVISIV